MLSFNVLGPVVLPHAVRVAVYLFVSGGLTLLLNSVATLHLNPETTALVMLVINVILAALAKWYDASSQVA